MTLKGKVYIVGAGPGDSGLLTLKAAESITRAEVVVYDRLLGEGIIGMANPEAELIYVGKEPDCHAVTQDQINQILVQKALAGKTVARVKGGDPFLFGRGGEEAEKLAENGIEFEIVPGVTSAIAAPAYGGIPVTHRDCCSSLHIITGHQRADHREKNGPDYRQLGSLDGTLVFLMGAKNMAEITDNLIAGGKNPATPAAVIENGTTFKQRVITAKLAEIAQSAAQAGLGSPAVLVVGEVVNLREKLQWFPRGPLVGKKIIVTRARKQAGLLVQKITALGGEVVEIPAIAILPPSAEDIVFFDRELTRIHEYQWLLFTSVNGVAAFWRQMRELKMDLRALAGVKIGVIGETTAQELWKYGFKADFIPASYTTAALLDGLKKLVGKGEKVLLPRADIAPADLEQGLKAAGMICTAVTAYRTVPGGGSGAEVQRLWEQGPYDYITFTSSSTVRHFIALLPQQYLPQLAQSKIVCIGPVTAATAREAGLKVDAVAGVHTMEGLIVKLLELEGVKTDALPNASFES
ncbi:MAG TPA: uroporphyrinogen-III C-methyltransferase [Firmicutes bacterium]|jgi:uroporphyrinogen III methyltransferase / synthase|nr:uroporphyrinogen-III C-methyltransferase [Bacillota bacterium]